MAKFIAKRGNFFQEDEQIWGVEQKNHQQVSGRAPWGLSSGVQVGPKHQPGLQENSVVHRFKNAP